MNIAATLKTLPFLSIIAASLMLTSGLSIAGDNSHGQYKRQYNQHGNKMTRQAHHRSKSRRHTRQPSRAAHHNRPAHNRQGVEHHYKTRSHYRHNQHNTHQQQYIDNTHAYTTVTHVQRPLLRPRPHSSGIALGLHTRNVTLILNKHR